MGNIRGQYLEDFAPGQEFVSKGVTVTPEAITTFASEYDPQPFHLDAEAAKHTIFGGLVASGWHTAALTMRMLVTQGIMPTGGIVGLGGEVSWPRAVYPGDTIHAEGKVLEVRPSQSRPQQGLVVIQVTTVNQRGEPVQKLVANLLVPRRPPASVP